MLFRMLLHRNLKWLMETWKYNYNWLTENVWKIMQMIINRHWFSSFASALCWTHFCGKARMRHNDSYRIRTVLRALAPFFQNLCTKIGPARHAGWRRKSMSDYKQGLSGAQHHEVSAAKLSYYCQLIRSNSKLGEASSLRGEMRR